MVKMLNVPDEKFNRLYDILVSANSIDELKVLLDINHFNYDKMNEINFLKWLWKTTQGGLMSKAQGYEDLRFLKKEFIKRNGDNTAFGFSKQMAFRNELYVEFHERYSSFFKAYDKMQLREKMKRIILSYAKKNINSLVPVSQAERWIKMKLLGHHGKSSALGEMKDTLLWYWMKANPDCKLISGDVIEK